MPTFKHVGQNIYQRMSSKDKPGVPCKKAVDAWYKEVKDYTGSGEKFIFGHATGHFTQLIWANTDQVMRSDATTRIGTVSVRYFVLPGRMRIHQVQGRKVPQVPGYLQLRRGRQQGGPGEQDLVFFHCFCRDDSFTYFQTMFTHGAACSKCPAGTACKDSLCG